VVSYLVVDSSSSTVPQSFVDNMFFVVQQAGLMCLHRFRRGRGSSSEFSLQRHLGSMMCMGFVVAGDFTSYSDKRL